ncbi:hypothetical protein Back11_17560 [Paenibacillus baekrokdamisoli]|uniref:Wax synthase domain-containing protein n=1 Tax=Paenibacillus baekrokdamisoli TaxID=1712516 RepID=A0A3G9J3N4_9BACL|nr:membrane bound O-acyl transferase family-domain-containing protein [Paenibacillus baekrokdamisoli]MBB3072108.1 alginate O-acetyltransferase complex protein AlgI [Paenibacillus baekrokdamisoli]BBH20411.1 hypothetical protein Back11_17560 [Paenibacillus baekrokdamisoli]
MTAYLPHSTSTLFIYLVILVGLPAIGYLLAQLQSLPLKRVLAWGMTIGSLTFIDHILLYEPVGFRMLAIIGALLFGMKSVIYVEYSIRAGARLSVRRWIAFHLWVGMRPYLFAKRRTTPYKDAKKYMVLGVKRLILGLILIAMSSLLWRVSMDLAWNPRYSLIGTTALLLVGLSFTMHFGLFNLLTGIWRQAGFDCQQLFRNPLLSRSLNEFWSRRWNLAFSEMTTLGVYRPLAAVVGKNSAVFLAFIFSGVLHELAISLPVRSGFGWPMLYFLLHGIAMLLETALSRIGLPISKWPWLGRAWTMAWLILPITILFHPTFLKEIVWPIIDI